MSAINIIFDGAPGPEDSGRFVEVETDDGKSITIGQWAQRPDGLWRLRIEALPDESRDATAMTLARLAREVRYLRHYGNRDCMAMADDAMARGELDTAKGEGDVGQV